MCGPLFASQVSGSHSSQTRRQNIRQHAVNDAGEGCCDRRALLLGAAALAAVGGWPLPSSALTLEEVTPSIAPVGPLTDREAAIINIFESSSVAVANVFDVTLLVSSAVLKGRDESGTQQLMLQVCAG
jgi:hypothetical protein